MRMVGFDNLGDCLHRLVLLVGMTVCKPGMIDRCLVDNRPTTGISHLCLHAVWYRYLGGSHSCVFGHFQAMCADHGCQQIVNVMPNSVFLVFLRISHS